MSTRDAVVRPQEPIYGLAMMEELERHGYEISPGTMYPILHSMEEEGWLVRQERVVHGRVRKYYTATAAGREALAVVRGKIRELVEEVEMQHGTRPTAARAAPRTGA